MNFKHGIALSCVSVAVLLFAACEDSSSGTDESELTSSSVVTL